MECNKDEAIRAKTIAERKLTDKDFTGAKKFILKAQTLYPPLDGVSQMLTTLDVYIASETKVNNEVDWYAILGVNPNDDDETIRKHYRKLALMLHPDKNKSVGADGAFKLLSEAWSLLSDKSKRGLYNQRRSMRGFQHKNPSQNANGGQTFAKQPPPPPPPARAPPPPPPPVHNRSDTFWTICHRCKMHYEYLKLYLNHTLLCPNCHEPFLAKEMPPPVNIPNVPKPPNYQFTPGKTTKTTQKVPVPPVPKTTQKVPVPPVPVDHTVKRKAASVIQEVNDRIRKEREEFYSGWPSKKRKADDEVKIPFQMSTNNGVGLKKSFDGFSNLNNKVNRTRELTPMETRYMLMKKAQSEILKKLTELKEIEKTEKTEKTSEISENTPDPDPEEVSMNVPDPDFYDFDLERTENSFEDNQVWSAYDDDDGMPRFYALIHKVLSRDPLKMKISWLNSKTTSEFGSFDWLGYGFPKTCGEFRIGRQEVYKTLNSFSQKISWIKSSRGTVLIYPRKGQVWAVYRNWSFDWDENVPDDVIRKYDMVEVLEDYNEEKGEVSVSYLKKHSGFRTVFHGISEKSEVKVIKKEEMFRFSHQVPKYVLNGTEGQNCPKDCLELDPAAMSFEEGKESKGENGEER